MCFQSNSCVSGGRPSPSHRLYLWWNVSVLRNPHYIYAHTYKKEDDTVNSLQYYYTRWNSYMHLGFHSLSALQYTIIAQGVDCIMQGRVGLLGRTFDMLISY